MKKKYLYRVSDQNVWKGEYGRDRDGAVAHPDSGLGGWKYLPTGERETIDGETCELVRKIFD